MMSAFKNQAKDIDTKKFEIFFSKLELVLADFKNLNTTFNKVNDLATSKFNSRDFEQSLDLLSKSKAMSEENIVKALKELVSTTKSFGKEIGHIGESLNVNETLLLQSNISANTDNQVTLS